MEVEPSAPEPKPVPKTRSYRQPEPPRHSDEENSPPVPKTRRARLAALAQDINNWEDDLSHHVVK